MNLSAPLEDLLPGLRGQVLTALVRSPQPMTVREVARRVGTVSHSSVKLVLDSLADSGLVRLSMVSAAGHFYEFTDGHVLAEPLRKMDRALDEFAILANALVASWPTAPASVVLYGSVARGTSTSESDIDALIVWPKGSPTASWWRASRVDFTHQLQVFTGNVVNLVEFSGSDWHRAVTTDDPFVQSIREDGRTLFGARVRDLLAGSSSAALT